MAIESNKTSHKSSSFIIRNSGNSSYLTETKNIYFAEASFAWIKVPVIIRYTLMGVSPSYHVSHFALLKQVHFNFAIHSKLSCLDLVELDHVNIFF